MGASPCAKGRRPCITMFLSPRLKSCVESVATLQPLSNAFTSSPIASMTPPRVSTRALFFDAGHQLRGIDETQSDQEPEERRHHIDDGHCIDRLRRAHPCREDRIVKRDDERLAIGAG